MHPKTLLAAIAIASTPLVVTSRLVAQDVTAAPLEWIEPMDAPDQLPVENRPLRPRFPDDLRNTPDPGYVIVEVFTTEKGKRLSLRPFSTLPAYEDAVLHVSRDWDLKPGRRAGRPVNTFTRELVVFNPASASSKLATATPRLLAAELVKDPTRHAGKKEGWVPPEVVWATVSLDAAGGETGLEVGGKVDQTNLPPELRYDVAPKPRGRVLPVYPYGLVRDGVKGSATVKFMISETGKVSYAEVVKATQPEFGAAAVAMIEQWEFEPALRGGRPTQSVFSYTQEFSPDDTNLVPAVLDDLLALERKHPERIVSAGKLDAAPKLTAAHPPGFPRSLYGRVAKGTAMIELLVDEKGRARLPRIVSASDPAFGWAALQAVETWRFDPPVSGGKSVVTRVRVPFEFSSPPIDPK